VRADRLVENQELFKSANERLEGAVEDSVSPKERIPFLCECADEDCLGRVEMTLGEYSAVRTRDNRFFMIPNHLLAEGEDVVETNPGFHVTEK
jgi:hypothetical protein